MKSNTFRRLLSMLLIVACVVSIAAVGVTSTTAAKADVADTAEASNAEPEKNEYQIVSPVPSGSSISPIEQPARLDSLQGKRIALVGGSFSASVTHAVIAELLRQNFGCTTYYMTEEIGKSGTFNPNNISDKSKEFQENLKKYNIDAVISGNCGCGICTVKETGNGLAAEYAGIPAVVVGAEAFVPQIESTGYNTAGTLSIGASSIYLKGEFNNWGTTDAFAKTGNSDIVTLTKQLPAGSYEFKVHNAGSDTWYGKDDTTVTDTTNRLTLVRTGGNCVLQTTGGVYEFKFEISTNKLSVYYAENNAMDQQPTVTPTESTKTYILGDADGSGEVTILDATIIQRYLVGYTVDDPETLLKCGDIDGNELNIVDATTIQRHLVGYSSGYPIGEIIS